MRRSGYNSIRGDENNSTQTDGIAEDSEEANFTISSQPKPYTALFLIFLLFFVGLSTLIISTLILLGHLHDSYADRMIPLMILGLLMFIPGAYYARIVYLIAVKRTPGYSYDMIPAC